VEKLGKRQKLKKAQLKLAERQRGKGKVCALNKGVRIKKKIRYAGWKRRASTPKKVQAGSLSKTGKKSGPGLKGSYI